MAKKTIKKQKAKKSTLRFLVFGVASIIISGTVALSISKLWSENYIQKYKWKERPRSKVSRIKKSRKRIKSRCRKNARSRVYCKIFKREISIFKRWGVYY